ncbi:MAG: response regulator transcription factor [Clostridiales bacterium]|nr:response regulator transcription factor [Clostridiales bacterium]
MNEQILLVEDDKFLRDGLCEILTKEGYDVTASDCINSARKELNGSSFDLIILDVMLPDGSGFDLCIEIRKTNNSTPILFLTAFDDEIQVVRGLDSGADDYVTKPFKLLELLSRVRALMRRNKSSLLQSRDIVIDIEHMTVKKNDKSIFVTPTEFQILSMLIRNNGIIVTRGTLLQNIWDDNDNFIDDNTLSVHISRLREKIGANHIITVRGIGYRWVE